MSEPANTDSRQLPKKIGKYEIIRWLGEGQHGRVYLAMDPFVCREVAVKTSNVDAEKTGNLFFVEARAAGKLQHPNIVSLYDAGTEENNQYIVMEFVPGDSLARNCARSPGYKKMPLKQAVETMYQCCRALNYSHKQKVLHRDIKPSNVMMSENNEAKIMDFSIAGIMESEIRPDAIIGSPVYLSPEQITRDVLTPSTDLFSLSVLFYYIIAGQPPLYSEDLRTLLKMILNETPPLLHEINAQVPKELSLMVDKAMKKDPAHRFKSGEEMAESLLSIFNSLDKKKSELARAESHNALRRLHFFANFKDDEIQEMLDNSSWIKHKPGDRIIREGDTDNSFYIVITGEVDVYKGDIRISQLREGDSFGEMGFMGGARVNRTASVQASSEVMLLRINSVILDNLNITTQLRFYKVFSSSLIYRLSITTARLASK
ncbi:MAG: protein kinase [Gammaproteobacteria bacterium]|nr:protein kinase [Pseudomonadota bacterium]MCH9662491.1 protein kinase [Gammaproteobacteria bacterium]